MSCPQIYCYTSSKAGGGAFSGKDPTKVDRSAAYMARYAAKNMVAAGLADKLEIGISYAISVVPPPISRINSPPASVMSTPAPIAAARGSSIR